MRGEYGLMALHHSGKIVKCDQKVDITATFGSDLVLEGFTAIPNILLRYTAKWVFQIFKCFF